MNEMNELETQLRSWVPRRPSARISRALFGREAQKPSPAASRVARRSSPAFILNWLAPALAAATLVFAFLHLPTNPAHSSRSAATPFIAVILSNQSLGSILLEASNREPAIPVSDRPSFEMNGLGKGPKVFGVATSGVSTGASERLPDWPSQPQMEERGDFPNTNGARLVPQAAIPTRTTVWLCAERRATSCAALAGFCPERTADNSPTFQRWEPDPAVIASPEGTTDNDEAFQRSESAPAAIASSERAAPMTTLSRTHSSGTLAISRLYPTLNRLITHNDSSGTCANVHTPTTRLASACPRQLDVAADYRLCAASPAQTLC